MTRMGHDSARAAMIYQHASSEADRTIADALSDLLTTQERTKDVRRDGGRGDVEGPEDGDDGAAGALIKVG